MGILPQTTLDLMRKALPKGWTKRISKITGFSTGYVWAVMNGRKNCEDIISAARSIIREEKTKDNSTNQEILNELK